MLRTDAIRRLAAALVIAAMALVALPGGADAQAVRPPGEAAAYPVQEPGQAAPRDFTREVPPALAESGLAAQGPNSSAALWREVRSGELHTVSIPNPQAGMLVHGAGAEWVFWRDADGPLVTWGLYGLAATLALLALFYLLRGRIRVDHGLSGRTILRFGALERFGHWLLAGSFLLLMLTGLNLLMGKAYLMPLIGKEAFAQISIYGKWVHNNVAWAFMAGIVLTFAMWVLHNLPHRTDFAWMAKGGGLFVKGVHPPARKFNAGQKLIFWSTVLLGGSISASGLSLLFPGQLPMFAGTFETLNALGAPVLLGYELPTTLTVIQELQYAQIWHTMVSLAMMVIIIAHIYIGSVGMQGAFAAMGSGRVDRNWALEHHSLWVEEEERKAAEGRRSAVGAPAATPAE